MYMHSKEINLKGSQRIDATVTFVFHESICGSNCRRPAEQTWQTRQHQQQVVCLCALCLNLTACQLPLRGTMLFIIYTICYAVCMCLHSQRFKYWKSENAKWHQTSRKSERLNRNLWPSSVPVLKKRAKTINVCIQRQACAFSFSLVQYPVFNREINGGSLFFFSLFFLFPNGRKICSVDCSALAGPYEFWETEQGGGGEELKESLFKPSQFNFLTGLLNSLLESLQKILFCAAPLCLSSRKSVVCLCFAGSLQPIYAS